MTLDEAFNQGGLVRYDCGIAKEIVLTGRYIVDGDSDRPAGFQGLNNYPMIECYDKDDTFLFRHKRWVPVSCLDVIKEYRK